MKLKSFFIFLCSTAFLSTTLKAQRINVINNGQIPLTVNGIEIPAEAKQDILPSNNQLIITAAAIPNTHETITIHPEQHTIIVSGFFDETRDIYFIRVESSSKLPTDIIPEQQHIDPIPQAL